MKNWLRSKLRDFLGYDKEIKSARNTADYARRTANEAVQIIRERTDVHADIGMRDPNTIIMVGQYHGGDFVQVYSVRTNEFREVLDRLRKLKKYGEIRRVDAPGDMKAFIQDELVRY